MTSPNLSESNVTSSTLIISDTVTHITIPVSTKLDRNNFLTWKLQVEPIVDGFGLADHLNISFPKPNQRIEINEQSVLNPKFLTWHKQNRLLLGWLRSTISGSILSQHVSCQTAADLWDALHKIYSAVSSARIMELRLLQSTTKSGMSCNDYFEKMRGIADQLAAAGDPIPEADLIRHVLHGLGSDYNSFVVAVTTRSKPVTITDLHDFLLSHEALISSQTGSVSSLSSLPSVQNPNAFLLSNIVSTGDGQYRFINMRLSLILTTRQLSTSSNSNSVFLFALALNKT